MRSHSCAFLAQALCCVLFLAPATSAAGKGAPSGEGASAVREDEVTGRLANGLGYHIVKGDNEDGKIAIRLVVRVGNLETPTDYHLPHVVEHILFENIRDVARQGSIYDRIARMGGARGRDVNAFTGPLETVYWLKVPGGDPAALAAGLDIAEDWAHARDFTDEEIDRGRKTVIEEGRSASAESNADMNRRRAIWFGDHPRLAYQLPSNLAVGAPPKEVRDFLARFYRAGNMAVVVSGPVDPCAVLVQLRARFEDIPRGGAPRAAIPPPAVVGGHYMPDGTAVADEPVITISYKYRRAPGTRERARDAAVQLLADRLFDREVAASPETQSAALMNGTVQSRDFSNYAARTGVVILIGSFTTTPEHVAGAMEAALALFEKVRHSGFAAAEIEQARTEVLSALDAAAPPSADERAEAWQFRFADGQEEPERLAIRRAVATLAPADLLARLRLWLDPANRDVFVNARNDIVRPDVRELAAIAVRARRGALPAAVQIAPMLAPALVAPTPVSAGDPDFVRDGAFATARLPRSGATFIYRMTPGERVVLYALRRGGTQRLGADRTDGAAALERVRASGLGGVDRTALSRYLAAQRIEVRPFVSINRDGLSLSGPATTLALGLQIARTYISAPTCDAPRAGRETIPSGGAIDSAAAAEAALGVLIADAIGEPGDSDAPNHSALNPTALCALYTSMLGDTRDMVIAMEGPMDRGEAFAAVAATLDVDGNAPRSRTVFAPARATSGKRHLVRAGEAASANIAIIVKRPTRIGGESAGGEIAMHILKARLMDRLRAREKGIYSLDAYTRQFHDPDYLYVAVRFVADPENAERLISAARDEMERLRQSGASPREIAIARASVKSAPDPLSAVAERMLVYGRGAVPEVANDAEVNRWLLDNLRGELIDEFLRLPGSADPPGKKE